MNRKIKGKFYNHRMSANERGIPFLLTFEQWWRIWQDSGHWEDRGRGRNQYCMARFGDKGPYAIGNVRIITVLENAGERKLSDETLNILRLHRLGTRHTNETKEKIGLAQVGRKHSLESREKRSIKMMGNQYGKGNVLTREHCEIIGNTHRGKIVSKETRVKQSLARIGNKNGVGNKNLLGWKWEIVDGVRVYFRPDGRRK
jgi:NUMOD3 motif-containing protein